MKKRLLRALAVLLCALTLAQLLPLSVYALEQRNRPEETAYGTGDGYEKNCAKFAAR